MKRVIRFGRLAFEAFGAFSLAFIMVAVVLAQGTPFGNGRGAFRGDVYVPSSFNLWFGDNTSSDVSFQKNGASNVGIAGHLGAQGSTANTTTTPGASAAWGVVTLSSNTATVTFKTPFVAQPVCIATDQTTAQLVKAAPNANGQTVVLSDTVGATDVV